MAEDGKHVHPGMWLALQQDKDVFAIHLYTGGQLAGYGLGLMRRLLQHGGEAEELARNRLVYDDFLMIFVYGGDAHPAGHNYISAVGGGSHLVNTLARFKGAKLHLSGENGSLVIIEAREERNLFEYFWSTGHGGFLLTTLMQNLQNSDEQKGICFLAEHAGREPGAMNLLFT
jgi:hypothetical protein